MFLNQSFKIFTYTKKMWPLHTECQFLTIRMKTKKELEHSTFKKMQILLWGRYKFKRFDLCISLRWVSGSRTRLWAIKYGRRGLSKWYDFLENLGKQMIFLILAFNEFWYICGKFICKFDLIRFCVFVNNIWLFSHNNLMNSHIFFLFME